ncbi:MAG: TlpA family protein disulfide reductase [Nitrospinae bacterium]|nr:TlpA family protein disulfide reductase [Nitrospinota bacterium]MBF0634963.1 TlpA family protein disulfide reductase [Nitrospinota bacterium]
MKLVRNAALAAIFVCALSTGSALAVSPSALVGKPAPAFDLEKPDGGRISLASLKGSVVILTYWATWCAPCKVEMPTLEEAYKKHGGKGVIVIGVNFQQEKPQVKKFTDANKLTFPIAMDVDGKTADSYYIPGLPTTFFIGPDGVLAGYHEGVVKPELLEEWIAKLKGK